MQRVRLCAENAGVKADVDPTRNGDEVTNAEESEKAMTQPFQEKSVRKIYLCCDLVDKQAKRLSQSLAGVMKICRRVTQVVGQGQNDGHSVDENEIGVSTYGIYCQTCRVIVIFLA